MGRNRMTKVQIDSDRLRTLIRRKSNIMKVAEDIGCSERTIRRGLAEGEMSLELVMRLSYYLDRHVDMFADMDTYYNSINID